MDRFIKMLGWMNQALTHDCLRRPGRDRPAEGAAGEAGVRVPQLAEGEGAAGVHHPGPRKDHPRAAHAAGPEEGLGAGAPVLSWSWVCERFEVVLVGFCETTCPTLCRNRGAPLI